MIFAFVLDPKNTPKWIDSITDEETNEWPVREGTVYRNKNQDGAWNEYVITSFERDKSFTMKMKDGNYHVQYTLTPISETESSLEYLEWVIRGALVDPFTDDMLLTLKTVLET